jgi:hypothetical protein
MKKGQHEVRGELKLKRYLRKEESELQCLELRSRHP